MGRLLRTAGHGPAWLLVAVGPVLIDLDNKRQFRMLEFALPSHPCFGKGHDLVQLGIGHVENREFGVETALGVVFDLPFRDPHLAFNGKHVGDQLANQQ